VQANKQLKQQQQSVNHSCTAQPQDTADFSKYLKLSQCKPHALAKLQARNQSYSKATARDACLGLAVNLVHALDMRHCCKIDTSTCYLTNATHAKIRTRYKDQPPT
jgi:hypothetical protein